jgi:phosphatidylglycerol:prolipoprotein diacylglycerol transferase
MAMAFPYFSDLINALFGTQIYLPIPTFGLLTASAIAFSAWVLTREIQRYETAGRLPPHARAAVSQAITPAILVAFVGARVFHILDFPQEFLADPAAMIFTRSGFSIFGGLLFGLLAGVVLLKRHSVPVVPALDALAPALALGYAVGRLGCQLAGDGDWGIAADMALKPGWLPDWLWAQTYTGNVLSEVIPAPGVYPTPLYESMMALAMFGMLWALRSVRYSPGFLFSVYLLLAGFERLLIEKIRINVQYHVLGAAFTQAEAISFALIVAGLIGVLVTKRHARLLPRLLFSMTVLSALSACVAH